jgi:hypothetical protein
MLLLTYNLTAKVALRYMSKKSNPPHRHSRESGNPAETTFPRSGQSRDVVSLREAVVN